MKSAALGVLGLAGLWLFLRWFERANLYFPVRELAGDPGIYGLKYEEHFLRAADGGLVHAWHIPRGSGDPLVVLCHGNGGNISHRLEKALILREAGASVLLFDYRGYGKSPGRPDEAGTYADGQAAYDFALSRSTRVVLYGESLGGAVAAELAARRPPAGLILESAFTSTVDMAHEVLPILPARLIIRNRYETLAKLPSVRAALLVLHSPEDDIVPFRMGRRLFEAAREPKIIVELSGDHNSGFLASRAVYLKALRDFLARLR